MEKIASFCLNHLNLVSGLYKSRQDCQNGTVVTTFDLRITQPNAEPCMDTAAMHSMEHLGATYLRNCPSKDEVIYFGPMGCKTGFYLVMFGDKTAEDVLALVRDTFDFIANYQGEIPGATPRDCGNYSLQNLDMSHFYAKKYLAALAENPSLVYPE